METASDENSEIVDKISGHIIGEAGKPGLPPETEELQIFADVFNLDLEIGSGASFEQYFRWADRKEILTIVENLKLLGLNELADTTETAIAIAFPDGIPEDNAELKLLTNWTEEQKKLLDDLYEKVSHLHGRVINKLGEYAVARKLVKMDRFQGLF